MTFPYKKILLPLDGSEFAAQAIPHAEAIANSQGAELILFEVIEDPLKILVSPPGMGAASGSHTSVVGIGPTNPDNQVHADAMDQAKLALDELATSLKHRKVNVVTDIDTGDPAECIVDYATANDVDLIVINTHGRTGIRRWAYGSVTHKVLEAAPCSVFVVRGS